MATRAWRSWRPSTGCRRRLSAEAEEPSAGGQRTDDRNLFSVEVGRARPSAVQGGGWRAQRKVRPVEAQGKAAQPGAPPLPQPAEGAPGDRPPPAPPPCTTPEAPTLEPPRPEVRPAGQTTRIGDCAARTVRLCRQTRQCRPKRKLLRNARDALQHHEGGYKAELSCRLSSDTGALCGVCRLSVTWLFSEPATTADSPPVQVLVFTFGSVSHCPRPPTAFC